MVGEERGMRGRQRAEQSGGRAGRGLWGPPGSGTYWRGPAGTAGFWMYVNVRCEGTAVMVTGCLWIWDARRTELGEIRVSARHRSRARGAGEGGSAGQGVNQCPALGELVRLEMLVEEAGRGRCSPHSEPRGVRCAGVWGCGSRLGVQCVGVGGGHVSAARVQEGLLPHVHSAPGWVS